MKKILITGKDSYIGTSFEKWVSQWPDKYSVDTIDVRDDLWKDYDFSPYDVVLHVAAIVHVKERDEQKYYIVNRDLTLEIAKKAKDSGVEQFIFMSTMGVYGLNGRVFRDLVITDKTKPKPKTIYAKSKFEAEKHLVNLMNDKFYIIIIRAPMVYGDSAPGNLRKLVAFVNRFKLIPIVNNKKSVIHVNKLVCTIEETFACSKSCILFPRDDEFKSTNELIEGFVNERHLIKINRLLLFPFLLIFSKLSFVQKVFGNLLYHDELNTRIIEKLEDVL